MHFMSDRAIKLGNPLETDYETYVAQVRLKNETLLQEARKVVCHLPWVEKLEDAARGDDLSETRVHIATTGSDGRLEKKGDKTSPLEALVLVEKLGTIDGITTEVRQRCTETLEEFGFFGQLEIKDLSRDKVSYCQSYTPPQAWPTIMVDAVALCEKNTDLLRQGREMLAQEVGQGKSGVKIISATQNRLSEYRKITGTGKGSFKGNSVKHFDPETGTLFYDQTQEIKVGSVKYGPLRSVQMFLAFRLLQFLRAHSHEPQLVHEFPTNTKEKIQSLLDHNALKLTAQNAKEMDQLYSYFLWCFYLSEHSYSSKQETVVTVPDPQLFRENIQSMMHLLQMRGY